MIGSAVYNLIKYSSVFRSDARAVISGSQASQGDCQLQGVKSLQGISLSERSAQAAPEYLETAGSSDGSINLEPMRITEALELPAGFYEQYDLDPSDTKQGPSTLDQEYLRITIYSTKHREAHLIAEQIRVILDRFSGTVNDDQIQSIQYQRSRDLYDEKGQAAGRQSDFKIRVIR
jgi:hypothetical protein